MRSTKQMQTNVLFLVRFEEKRTKNWAYLEENYNLYQSRPALPYSLYLTELLNFRTWLNACPSKVYHIQTFFFKYFQTQIAVYPYLFFCFCVFTEPMLFFPKLENQTWIFTPIFSAHTNTKEAHNQQATVTVFTVKSITTQKDTIFFVYDGERECIRALCKIYIISLNLSCSEREPRVLIDTNEHRRLEMEMWSTQCVFV